MFSHSYQLCRTNLVRLNAISAPTPQQSVIDQLVRLCPRCRARRLSRRLCRRTDICCSCRRSLNMICAAPILSASTPLQDVAKQLVQIRSMCRPRRPIRRYIGRFLLTCRSMSSRSSAALISSTEEPPLVLPEPAHKVVSLSTSTF